MARRAASSGRPRMIVLESLPPRSSAGSSWSGSVRRADHEDTALTRDAIDLREQLVDVAVVCLELAASGRRWRRSRR